MTARNRILWIFMLTVVTVVVAINTISARNTQKLRAENSLSVSWGYYWLDIMYELVYMQIYGRWQLCKPSCSRIRLWPSLRHRLSPNKKSNVNTVSAVWQKLAVSCCRRIYWSDCSVPATIQTARVTDGGDLRTIITDTQHSCIVDITIDFDST